MIGMKALRMLRRLWRQELGQGLVLAALGMLVILGFAAMAVDVGYWLAQKGEVQKAVDAAALAGAWELPDDSVAATAKAQEYLLKNGVDASKGDTISITFRRTYITDPTKWDTIVVTVDRPAQAWFARAFGLEDALIGNVHAAAAKGGGGGAFTPVDVVEVLDRTWSMSSAEMLRAKAGANALLEYFDPSLQHVGLAVLPAGDSWANPCPPSPSSDVWLPVSLSDDYQLPGGALDHSSRLWWTIDCLTTQSSGTYETNLGDPVKAATEELVAHGRPGEKWGIILLGDGVANVMPGTQHTGYLNCAGQTGQAPAPGGHGDGFEHNAMNACANDTNYAEDSPSGTNTSTSCTATTKDRHDFFNYGISVPTGNVVRGIEVRLDAWVDSTPLFSTRRMCVQLSWNGGTTWTAAKQTPSLTTSQTATYTLGANNDTWGRAWTLSELSNANFRVRVTDVFNSSSRTFYLDWAAVDVYYAPSSLGPCHYAADQADAAKALNPPIEIFTIGYGVNDPFNPGGNTCLDSSGPWHNRTGEELMEYMASGADHFFNEPSTADLRPIFESIGTKLAGGTHLVE